MTREENLNNPMGLRKSSDVFQGEKVPSPDADFKAFYSMAEGVRAGAKVLLTYYDAYQLSTISDIINRWAPPEENDTVAYIADVCDRTGVSADTGLDLHNPNIMQALTAAIIHHENGEDIDPAIVHAGVQLAYA